MYPFRTIKEDINMFNTKTMNIIVQDITMAYHFAAFDYESGTVKNFHTGKIIDQPILWMYLPSFNGRLWDQEMEALESSL